MKIVIDTNAIISSLIRDGVSRKIIFNDFFDFITPEYTLIEINNHKSEIIKKINCSEAEFDILVSFIFENIQIISSQEYENYFEVAKDLISDIDDVVFISLALSSKADGIWSDDSHFFEQEQIKIFRTKEMVEFLN